MPEIILAPKDPPTFVEMKHWCETHIGKENYIAPPNSLQDVIWQFRRKTDATFFQLVWS